MRAELVAAIEADLSEYSAGFEDTEQRPRLLRGSGLARLLGTVGLIPEHLRGGDVLQLGAWPYLLTLCLRRACSGRLTLANYFGTPERRGEQVLTSRRTDERLRFEYDVFNVETEDFPYPDASFDVVVFSEIIEHLALDPVRALSEIHRVLRHEGVAIITTPNAISVQRLEAFLTGESSFVDRYAPAFGYGARHNREYQPDELRELLESTGFVLEEFVVRDLAEVPLAARLRRAVYRRLLARYSDHSRREHMFARARRLPRFRWSFPARLFGHMEPYVLARHPWVEMGVNDSIQCVFGWSPLEAGSDGKGAQRWTRGAGQCVLRSPQGASRVCLECFAPAVPGAAAFPIRLTVRHRSAWHLAPWLVYADEIVRVERGAWRTVALPLVYRPGAREEIEVAIAPEPDAMHAPALAALPEQQRGLAVRRVWLESNETTDG